MKNSLTRSHLSKSERQIRKDKTISFVILFVVCLFWVLPFVYLFGTSLKDEFSLMSGKPTILPEIGHWTFEHYLGFLNTSNHGRLDNLPIWMINSFVVTFTTVILALIVDTLAAYALVFFKFRGRNIILAVLIVFMTIPGVIGTTPLYSMFVSIGKTTGLSNVVLFSLKSMSNGIESVDKIYLYPYLWLICPGVSGVFNLLLMKNFFDSIPKDIIESAKSDGASDFLVFRRIVLPLARSTILLIVLFTFVGSWNDLLWPQLITGGKTLNMTINVALVAYTGGVNSWSLKAAQSAAAMFALMPILIVFIIVQNKMIDGLANTGVKR